MTSSRCGTCGMRLLGEERLTRCADCFAVETKLERYLRTARGRAYARRMLRPHAWDDVTWTPHLVMRVRSVAQLEMLRRAVGNLLHDLGLSWADVDLPELTPKSQPTPASKK